jgi:hypothetical protein
MDQKIIQSNEVTNSDWTISTLRIHLQNVVQNLENLTIEKFKHHDETMKAAMLAQREAVQKAEVANEKRFDSVNEFRRTLSDQTSSFMPRQEFMALYTALNDKIEVLNTKSLRSEGYSSGKEWAIGAGIGIFVTLANVVIHFLARP